MKNYSLNETQDRPTSGSFDLVRISHAKAILDISPNTLRTYARDGLAIYKRGKAAFVSKLELAAYIRGGAIGKGRA